MSHIFIHEQLRPTTTSAEVLYNQPDATTETRINNLFINNPTTVEGAQYDVYLDDDGTTADDTTLIASGILPAGPVYANIQIPQVMTAGIVGRISVKVGTANTFNFTLSGEEFGNITVPDDITRFSLQKISISRDSTAVLDAGKKSTIDTNDVILTFKVADWLIGSVGSYKTDGATGVILQGDAGGRRGTG